MVSIYCIHININHLKDFILNVNVNDPHFGMNIFFNLTILFAFNYHIILSIFSYILFNKFL
jgi:hypothetical protein